MNALQDISRQALELAVWFGRSLQVIVKSKMPSFTGKLWLDPSEAPVYTLWHIDPDSTKTLLARWNPEKSLLVFARKFDANGEALTQMVRILMEHLEAVGLESRLAYNIQEQSFLTGQE